MLIAVTLFGGWLGYELHWIRQRHAFIAAEALVRERLPTNGVRVAVTSSDFMPLPAMTHHAPAMLWLFGEDGFTHIFILADAMTVQELTDYDRDRVQQARRLFPEATVKTVHVRSTPTSSSAESADPP